MNSQKGLRILYALFFLNLAIISWQEIKQSKSPIGWPRPQRFVGLAVAFSMLAILAEIATAELAAVIGAGLTLGILMNSFTAQTAGATVGNLGSSSTGAATPPTGAGLTGTIQV
jgi:hypothetical protein